VRKFLICQGSRVVLLAKGKRLHQGKKPGLEKKFLRDEPCILGGGHYGGDLRGLDLKVISAHFRFLHALRNFNS